MANFDSTEGRSQVVRREIKKNLFPTQPAANISTANAHQQQKSIKYSVAAQPAAAATGKATASRNDLAHRLRQGSDLRRRGAGLGTAAIQRQHGRRQNQAASPP